MSSKRKVIISISVCAIVILAAIIAVISVLAATNTTVKSGINITFTPDKQVKATISAAYAYVDKDGNEGSFTNAGSTIIFDGTEEDNVEENLTGLDINLDSANPVVIFRFSFENTVVDEYVKATIDVELSGADKDSFAYDVGATNPSVTEGEERFNGYGQKTADNSEQYLWVRVKLANGVTPTEEIDCVCNINITLEPIE